MRAPWSACIDCAAVLTFVHQVTLRVSDTPATVDAAAYLCPVLVVPHRHVSLEARQRNCVLHLALPTLQGPSEWVERGLVAVLQAAD